VRFYNPCIASKPSRAAVLMMGAAIFRVGAAVSGATPALPPEIIIPGQNVYPESLTSSADGAIFIGSIAARSIFRVKAGAALAGVWVQPDAEDTLGIYGVLADDRTHTLWACYASIPHQRWRLMHAASVLQAFDLRSGAVKARYELPSSGAFCNDIAVAVNGTVYATDSNNMEIVRLGVGSSKLEVWSGGGAFGPKGGLLDGISILADRVFVNTLGSGKVFAVTIAADGTPAKILEMKLQRPIDGPDGMRAFGADGLLLVESRGGRLLAAKIRGDTLSFTTLKQGFPDGPVAVTRVGGSAYVLEGRLASLYGSPAAGSASKPFHATAVQLDTP
jgi:hypothetical protein